MKEKLKYKIQKFNKWLLSNKNHILWFIFGLWLWLLTLILIALIGATATINSKVDKINEPTINEPRQAVNLGYQNNLYSFKSGEALDSVIYKVVSSDYIEVNIRSGGSYYWAQKDYAVNGYIEINGQYNALSHIVIDYDSSFNPVQPVNNGLYIQRVYIMYNVAGEETGITALEFDEGDLLLDTNFVLNINSITIYEDTDSDNVCVDKVSGGLLLNLLDYALTDLEPLSLGLDKWLPTNYISQARYVNNVVYGRVGSSVTITLGFDIDFISNGKLYERIYLVFNIAYYVMDNNYDLTEYPNNQYQVFDSMWYALKDTTSSDTHYSTYITLNYFYNGGSLVGGGLSVPGVCDLACSSRVYDLKAHTGSNNDTTYEKIYLSQMPYMWSDINYKYLYLNKADLDRVPYPLTSSSSSNYSVLTNKTWREILLLGYADTQYTSYGDNSSNGLGGVFTLIASAFTGLMPLLNIQILPNITLGLLLFIPLIATIIIVVIRLVKK